MIWIKSTIHKVVIPEKNGKGRVVFCGETQFADGVWVGVILDEPKGKNNGTVKDVKYFECEPNYGLFIRPNQVGGNLELFFSFFSIIIIFQKHEKVQGVSQLLVDFHL